jgi:hypothetical protein
MPRTLITRRPQRRILVVLTAVAGLIDVRDER